MPHCVGRLLNQSIIGAAKSPLILHAQMAHAGGHSHTASTGLGMRVLPNITRLNWFVCRRYLHKESARVRCSAVVIWLINANTSAFAGTFF